jgi:hypothetical protein
MANARFPETADEKVRALGDWFYSWELRGRGWRSWTYSVDLEPPFRPLAAVDAAAPEPDAASAGDNPAWRCLALPAAEWPAGIIDPLSHLLAYELWSEDGRIAEAMAVSREDFDDVAACMVRRDRAVAPTGDAFAAALRGAPNAFRFIELGLAREFLVPMADGAPLAVRLAREALAGLAKDELACVQILISPLRQPWADEMIRAARGPSGDGLFDDDLVAACRAKIEKPLFAVAVRIAAFAPNETRAERAARTLVKRFLAPATPDANGLIALPPASLDRDAVLADLSERRTHRSGMILNAAELSLLLPIGSREGLGPRLRLSAADRLREMRVIGPAGRTRTTFVADLVLRDLEERSGVALVDCDGAVADIVMRRLPRHRLADVTLLDPARAPVPLDLLNAPSDAERAVVEGEVIAALGDLASGWGASASAQFADLVARLREQEAVPTLADVARVARAPALASALETLLGDEGVRAILAGPGRALDFARLLESGVLIASLPAARHGAARADALAGLVFAKLRQAFAACADRTPFFLYVVGAGAAAAGRALALAPVARRCGAGVIVVEETGEAGVPRTQVLVTTKASSRLVRMRLGETMQFVEVPDLPEEPRDAAQSVEDIVSVTARRYGLPDRAIVAPKRSSSYPKIARRLLTPSDLAAAGPVQNP